MTDLDLILRPLGNPGFLEVHSVPVFTDAECDRIRAMCAADWRPAGVTGYAEGESPVRPHVRSVLSQPLPVDEDGWPLSQLAEVVASVNGRQYRFDLRGFLDRDPPSVLWYQSDVVDHFHPHRDAGPDFATRKLSCVVQLSDPADYRGGALVFPEERGLASSARGTMTLFPSFLVHEVTPVVSGERFAIVAWVHGPTFR